MPGPPSSSLQCRGCRVGVLPPRRAQSLFFFSILFLSTLLLTSRTYWPHTPRSCFITWDAPSSLLTSGLSSAPMRVWRSSLICTHVRTHVHTHASCWHNRLLILLCFNYFLFFHILTLRWDSVCPFMRRYRVWILGNVLLQFGYIGRGLQWANDHPPAHLTTSNYMNSSSVRMLSPSLDLAWLTQTALNR